jgi:hypothetical protein
MVALIAKVLAAWVFAIIGQRLWRTGSEWNENGEIPKDFIEARNPKPLQKGESGFGTAIVWQKFSGVLFLMFAGLCVLSIILQLMGLV